MHRKDITDEELEFWLDGEKYTISHDSYDEEARQNGLDDLHAKCLIVRRKSSTDGCTCTKCGDVFPYAEPNQEDGSFRCWNCRQ